MVLGIGNNLIEMVISVFEQFDIPTHLLSNKKTDC